MPSDLPGQIGTEDDGAVELDFISQQPGCSKADKYLRTTKPSSVAGQMSIYGKTPLPPIPGTLLTKHVVEEEEEVGTCRKKLPPIAWTKKKKVHKMHPTGVGGWMA